MSHCRWGNRHIPELYCFGNCNGKLSFWLGRTTVDLTRGQVVWLHKLLGAVIEDWPEDEEGIALNPDWFCPHVGEGEELCDPDILISSDYPDYPHPSIYPQPCGNFDLRNEANFKRWIAAHKAWSLRDKEA